MELRKVKVYVWEQATRRPYCEKILDGQGLFHAWGVGYEEFESGPGNYSTAIVEMPDGSVRNVPVELVMFEEGGRKMTWKVDPELQCQDCGAWGAIHYHQRTQYANEQDNWVTLCPTCKERNDEYWDERWDEYYRECM